MIQIKQKWIWLLILTLIVGSSVTALAEDSTIVVQTKKPIEQTLAYFQSIQNADGGFPFEEGKESSLTMTTWVLMALGAAEENVKDSKWTVNGNTPIDYINTCSETIEETTEYARIGLALNAIGEKPIYKRC